MKLDEDITFSIDAEARLPVASAQLVRISLNRPTDHVRGGQETYRLDLGLTPRPRNARACYRDRWGPNRFKHIGDVLVLPPGETVETRSDPIALQRSIVCHLHPEPMREWFDGDLHWSEKRLESSLDVRSRNIRSMLLRLATELEHPGLASEALLAVIVTELAIELGRYCHSIADHTTYVGLAPWRLRRIDERLNSLASPPTLPELAQLCGVSVSALTRGFRSSRGVSIGDYIIKIQLEHAQQMLSNGDAVKVVAYSLGFASTSSFCHAFRRVLRESPGQFRDRMLSQRRYHS